MKIVHCDHGFCGSARTGIYCYNSVDIFCVKISLSNYFLLFYFNKLCSKELMYWTVHFGRPAV